MIQNDTIVAPITPSGSSAVAAVRVSGPAVVQIIRAISPKGDLILASPRTAFLSPILDLAQGDSPLDYPILDYGLFLYFRSPASYTGEEVVEINLHGSPYLLKQLVRSITAAGARIARPGEFTERAFHHGKVDLAQAEAIADLIASETEAQAKIAREQLEGRLSGAISDLGEPLRDLVAEIEARIDFPEEGVEPAALNQWREIVSTVCTAVERYIDSFKAGKLWRDGAAVAIVGAPNAGKSSLLNRLLGEDRAIVTPIPGTTRDSIEERITLNGLFVRLFDTAGLDTGERTLDQVETLGVERSWSKAKNSDLILFLFDAAETGRLGGTLSKTDQALLNELKSLSIPLLAIGTKIDLVTASAENLAEAISKSTTSPPLFISSVTGSGIDQLTTAVTGVIANLARGTGELMVSNQRHLEALTAAKNSLAQAKEGLGSDVPAELVSLDIRSALSALNEIIGVTPNEDILGRIFSKFCIGK